MLGDLIGRGLLLVMGVYIFISLIGKWECRMIVGYAYPAFECFKTVESNNTVDTLQLRFWCQYWIIVAVLSVCERFVDVFVSWIIVAVLSVCERFVDVFVSWLPLYGEMKLAFIIYLWYPKTKGTSYVYESMLRPLVSKHETGIDKQLTELRLRAWDAAIYYYQNCTDLGQSAFFNVIPYLANQSTRLKGGTFQNDDSKQARRG